MSIILLTLVLLQNTAATYSAANADFEAGRWADAAGKYEMVLREDAAHIPSRFNLAVCYTKLGDIDRAIATYRTLLALDDSVSEAHTNLALLLDQTGKHDEAREQKTKAREYLEKTLSADPHNLNVRKQLAATYFDDKDYRKAVPILVEIVQSEPANVDYLYLLGKSYEQLKAYPQAAAVLQQAVRIKPDYLEAYSTLGVVFYAQEDWQRAAQAMSRVVELKPMDALAHFVFATCLDKLGNAKEAIVQYNKFLELDDGSSDARSFQARQRAKTLERRLKR